MNADPGGLPCMGLPQFLDKTEQICQTMREMSNEALKKLWKCNDQLAQLNVERLQGMELRRNLTPAIVSYEGIQYRYMAPGVFTTEQLSYIQEHLRILSGFYGLLLPFDGVTPYRLEMQAKLSVAGAKDLYAFWGDSLARTLLAQTNCIVNLASREYSICIAKYLPDAVRFITCIFAEEISGKIIEKATLCKMARGEMVRFMAENNVQEPEKIQAFNRLQFTFSPEHSDENTYVFIKGKKSD